MTQSCPSFVEPRNVAPIQARAFNQRGVGGPAAPTQDVATYALVKSGPEVIGDEVELPDVMTIEVLVLWGRNVLHVEHLSPGTSFSVGEEETKVTRCNYFIPSEKLGTSRLPLLVGSASQPYVVLPTHAKGWIELPGQARMTLDEARRHAVPCGDFIDGRQMPLLLDTRVRIEVADFVFQLASVRAGKPAQRGLSSGIDWSIFSYFGLSFGAIGSFVASMAFFTPSLVDADELGVNQEQLYLIRQYLDVSAERERETKPAEPITEGQMDRQEGGTGTRAKSEEGKMGTRRATEVNRHYTVQGPKDNIDPHLARLAAIREAQKFGMIGMLTSGLLGDPKAPIAPWGRDESLGVDAESHLGNMWGDAPGESIGGGGLGLSGSGEGSGGRGEGIGLGEFGALGQGDGLGTGQGIGNGHGMLGKGHRTRPPRVREGGETFVSGRLPGEVIQRIVRQNYGRFRMCYEQGLTRNPNLQGRVQVRFAIDREGTVISVQNGGSDLPDSAVTTCVMNAYYGLSFPKPEGGIVTVVYPIMFQPG